MNYEELRLGSVLLRREGHSVWLVVGFGSKPGQISWLDLLHGAGVPYSHDELDLGSCGTIDDAWEIIL